MTAYMKHLPGHKTHCADAVHITRFFFNGHSRPQSPSFETKGSGTNQYRKSCVAKFTISGSALPLSLPRNSNRPRRKYQQKVFTQPDLQGTIEQFYLPLRLAAIACVCSKFHTELNNKRFGVFEAFPDFAAFETFVCACTLARDKNQEIQSIYSVNPRTQWWETSAHHFNISAPLIISSFFPLLTGNIFWSITTIQTQAIYQFTVYLRTHQAKKHH